LRPGSGQSRPDRPDRTTQLPGRRVGREALQVAEHDRSPVTLGEPVDLIKKDGDLVDPGAVRILE